MAVALVAAVLLISSTAGSAAAEIANSPFATEEILAALSRGTPPSAEVLAAAAAGGRVRAIHGERSTLAADFAASLDRLARLTQHSARSVEQGEGTPARDAVERFLAVDLLIRRQFTATRQRLETLRASTAIRSRLEAAERRYVEATAPLVADLAVQSKGTADGVPSAQSWSRSLERARALLARQRPSPDPVLRASRLPFDQLSLPVRAPLRSPIVTPTYRDATSPSSTAADLASTPEAPLGEAILAKADALGHDYVAIYEFVRNSIRTEWYAGSLKGAEGTLASGAGNSVDQASLLIALFRASGMASRYVHGVLELPVEAVAADLGLADAAKVPDALRRAGVAFDPVVRGGRVAAVAVEATWVSAHVPYSNYRGAVVDFSGRTWLPLLPSIKGVDRQPPTGLLGRTGFAPGDFVSQYLAAPQQQEPLAAIRQQAEQYLTSHPELGPYAAQLGSSTIAEQRLGLLPNEIPSSVAILAVTAEEAALTPERRQRLRVTVRAGARPQDPVILDATFADAELLGRRFTLSYLPATVDDADVVDAWGGLDLVPAYLVRVRPQLKIAGRSRAVARQGVAMGSPQQLTIELLGPWGSAVVEHRVIAGAYQAIGVDWPGVTFDDPDDDRADTERLAARLLASVGHRYAERWSSAEDELAALANVTVVRPLPALALTINSVAVETLLDLPYRLEWQGVSLDAALRVAEPIGNGAAASGWMQLAALQGSSLEHRVFEELFAVPSISADRGLALARGGGQTIAAIDASNLAAELAEIDHPAEVEADVASWVGRGLRVEIPQAPLAFEDWRGSVWRAVDTLTGAAGYFISGHLAGGSTAQQPGNWLLAFLAEALAAPYAAAPNTDPLAGAVVTKLAATDRQEARVGQLYGLALAVRVQDESGRAVQGAPVTFTVWSGGGALVGAGGHSFVQLTTFSNAVGIASARFRSGERTAAEPVFLRLQPSDLNLTRALMNLVEVSVASRHGAIAASEPFQLLALPEAPVTLRRTDTAQTHFVGYAGDWTDTIRVAVEDSYGNPVSNVEVTFSSDPNVFETPECTNRPFGVRITPAALFHTGVDANGIPFGICPVHPNLGECGSQTLVVRSGVYGTWAGVILGDSVAALYRVRVNAIDKHLDYSYGTLFSQTPGGHCGNQLAYKLRVSRPLVVEDRTIDATGVLQPYLRPIEARLAFWNDIPSGIRGFWQPTTGDVRFEPAHALARPMPHYGGGLYRDYLTTGPLPGPYPVRVALYAIDLYAIRETSPDPTRPLTWAPFTVWAVKPSIEAFLPTPLAIDAAGRTTSETQVRYFVDPPEYRAGQLDLELSRDGAYVGVSPGDSYGASGKGTIQRGFAFDSDQRYDEQVTLNRGSLGEVRSPLVRVPLYQPIFADVGETVSVSQDVDLANGRVCMQPDAFDFTLTQAATVTLVMRKIEALAEDGSLELGSEVVLIDGEALEQGSHSIPITPGDLLPGDYRFELRGVSLADGHEDVERGLARSRYNTRDALPIGHALVEGVDLFDGHLTLSAEDFSINGRVVPLAFSRTYASSAGGEPGTLGLGWSHNWASKVIVTPCGEAILTGGEGSGMRFVDDGAGGLRPLRGHHGALVPGADNTFDFYAKGGNRYHYRHGAGSEWVLDFVADPNGNKVELVYEPGSDEPRLAAVKGDGGRALRFTHQFRQFALWQGEVISRIEGPGGIVVALDYDVFGNLSRVTREPQPDASTPSRSTTYEYDWHGEHPLDTYHLLVSAKDDLSGAETKYAYVRGGIRVPGDDTAVVVPSYLVESVTKPEGGVFGFAYDLAGLGERDGDAELVQRVSDPRQKETVYHLNSYGSPVRVVDPLGHETRMEWDLQHVVVREREDGNGNVTRYEYDEHGNPTREEIAVVDADGQLRELAASTAYRAPVEFEPPYIKNRVSTRTDRNGNTTTFLYDARGNLLSSSVEVASADGQTQTVTTRHTYFANGDRQTTTDPRGTVTRFAYDAFGNLETVTDVEGPTVTRHDPRGRPSERIDKLGRRTLFGYDHLDRVVRVEHPLVQDESAPAIERTEYDDVQRTRVEVDALERETTTRFDREGRPVEVVNAAGATKAFGYDAAGNKILETTWFDAATPRQDTTFEYDDAGRLSRRVEPLSRVTDYEYDGVGNVVRETLRDEGDPTFRPRVTEHGYDALNRAIRRRRFLGEVPVVEVTKYDGEGNTVLRRDALGRETRLRYDALDRLIETVEPEWKLGEHKVTRHSYDGNGNLVQEVRRNEPVDQVRSFGYDALNRRRSSLSATGGETLYTYDLVGNLVEEIDPRLHRSTYTYDERNRRRSATRHLDRISNLGAATTSFNYDAIGNLIGERWPNGNVVSRQYDALDRLIRTADSLGELARYEHDARGNLTLEVDANGGSTVNEYDALDRLVGQQLPEDRTLTFTYDAAGNRATARNARQLTTTFSYDTLDRLVEVKDPQPFGTTQKLAYDLVGNKVAETDRRGHTTNFEHDELNRLIAVVDPPLSRQDDVRRRVAYTYDAVGNRRTETDRRGLVSETQYDAESRPTMTFRDGVRLSTLEYDAAGNKTFEHDAKDHVTGFEYDERNLPLAVNRPLAAITRYTRDLMGDVVVERDPENRQTERAYDERRRLTGETNAAGETTLFEYDGKGNRTAQVRPKAEGNPERFRWSYVYDGADRLESVTNPRAETTTYGYDGNGNRTSQLDAEGRTTSFAFDELDRLVELTYPATAAGEATETYGYDGNGNLIARTDPKGQAFETDYDEVNRTVEQRFPLSAGQGVDELQKIATDYDENGNVVAVREVHTGPTGTRASSRTYDDFERLTSVTDGFGKTLSYGYDLNGNRTTLRDPDGLLTQYGYDDLNRVASVTLSASGTDGPGATVYEYWRDSRLRNVSYPNGSRTSYAYDQAGRVESIDNRQGTVVVSQYGYRYDKNGNRTEQRETNGGAEEITTYGYDDADRLLEVAYPEATVTYTYDKVGNRRTEKRRETATGALTADKTLNYNDRDQLVTIVDAAPSGETVSYAYDANGNQIAKTENDLTTNFHFDSRDQLATVERDLPEGGFTLLGRYTYDHQGLRIEKRTADGVIRYTYDDQSVLLQFGIDALTIAKYDYGPDRLLSLSHRTEGRSFYLFDALGSPVDVVAGDGAVRARYRLDVWGNTRSQSGDSWNPLGFTGYEEDDESGLLYARARFYDADLGRFLSEDPFAGEPKVPPSLNRYLYGYANPTVYVDPTGQQTKRGDQQRSRVLMPGEEEPPGWTVRVVDEENGVRIAIPPARGPAAVPEEPSWWEKVKERASEEVTAIVESLERPGVEEERLDEAIGRNTRSIPTSSDDEQDVATAQQSKTGIAEVTERSRDLAVASGKAVGTSVEVYQAAAGGGALIKLLKDGVERYFERRALRKALLEGWRPPVDAADDALKPRMAAGSRKFAGPDTRNINAAIGEEHGWQRALDAGRLGIKAPTPTNRPGVDYITFDPKTGEIILTDAKYRGPGGKYPVTISPEKVKAWTAEAKNAIAALPEGPLKQEAQAALQAGKVRSEIFKWPQ